MHIFVLLLRKSSENYHAFYSSTCGKKAANRTVRLRPWYYYPTYMGLFSGLLWMSQCALDDYSLSFFALLFVHFYWLFSVVVIVFQTLRAWQKNYISWLHQKRNSFIGKRFGGKKVVWPLFGSKWKYVHCKYLVMAVSKTCLKEGCSNFLSTYKHFRWLPQFWSSGAKSAIWFNFVILAIFVGYLIKAKKGGDEIAENSNFFTMWSSFSCKASLGTLWKVLLDAISSGNFC